MSKRNVKAHRYSPHKEPKILKVKPFLPFPLTLHLPSSLKVLWYYLLVISVVIGMVSLQIANLILVRTRGLNKYEYDTQRNNVSNSTNDFNSSF